MSVSDCVTLVLGLATCGGFFFGTLYWISDQIVDKIEDRKDVRFSRVKRIVYDTILVVLLSFSLFVAIEFRYVLPYIDNNEYVVGKNGCIHRGGCGFGPSGWFCYKNDLLDIKIEDTEYLCPICFGESEVKVIMLNWYNVHSEFCTSSYSNEYIERMKPIYTESRYYKNAPVTSLPYNMSEDNDYDEYYDCVWSGETDEGYFGEIWNIEF
jgi:hypothetical protein